LWDNHHAVDNEADGVFMRVADVVVSNNIRHAPSFDRNRIVILYGLYRGPFSFPKSHYKIATGHVRFRVNHSAGAGFGKAMPGRLGAVRPPASWSLKIILLLFRGPVRFP
jgi:hypothetical protein